MMIEMSDRWWTVRIAILFVFVSVVTFWRGYQTGYLDALYWIESVLHTLGGK